jgi:hypothetical protein
MTSEFNEVMAQRTNAELIAILSGPKDDYQPAALEAAERVFNSRNLPEQEIAAIRQAVKEEQAEADHKANEPLEGKYKVIAFIFPRMSYLLPDELFDEAYVRKSKEIAKWHFYGTVFYASIILFIILLEMSTTHR